MTLLGMAPGQAQATYAPLLVISFGFDRLKANAMMSIGAWFMILTSIVWGIIADKTKRRGLMVFLGLLGFWGLMVCTTLVMPCPVAFTDQFHPMGSSQTASSSRPKTEICDLASSPPPPRFKPTGVRTAPHSLPSYSALTCSV